MKNIEIERKFIVLVENLPDLSKQAYRDINQGYIQNFLGSSYIYRLRQVLHMSPTNYNLGEQCYQTIKGTGTKIREEYEVELLKPQFHILWPLCKNISVHKYRYELPLEGHKQRAYLDVYKNNLNGLYTVEVEFDNELDCDSFIAPSWFGEEVTHLQEYSNFYLAMNGIPKKIKL
jgi:CYTH domain-containing protein